MHGTWLVLHAWYMISVACMVHSDACTIYSVAWFMISVAILHVQFFESEFGKIFNGGNYLLE